MAEDQALSLSQIRDMKDRQDRHEGDSVREHEEIWRGITSLRESVDSVRKRPPAWCMAVVGILSSLLGSALTVIGFLIS